MKYLEDYFCGTLLFVLGIIILNPFGGGDDPIICPQCGGFRKFLLSDIAAFSYVVLGGYSIFNGVRQRQKRTQIAA